MQILVRIIFLVFTIVNVNAGVLRYKDSTITKFKISPWRPNHYQFEYETSLGVSRKEIGNLKKTSNGKHYFAIVGFYRYKAPNNKFYHVDYMADEKGFHPIVRITDSIDDSTAKPKVSIEDDNIHFPEDVSTMPPMSRSNLVEIPSLDGKEDTPEISKDADSGLGNRFGLPPGVIGSLLG